LVSTLLREVAGDTAGAFVLLPQGQSPQPAVHEPTTWAALADTIHRQSAAAIQTEDGPGHPHPQAGYPPAAQGA
jgi:serine/threonine-protein kinase HipA